MSDWISVEDRLPEDKQRVIIMTNQTNVFDWHGELKQIYLATFIRGRTAAEVVRDKIMCSHDQHGNNLRPYGWNGDGPLSWWGQEVTHWQPMPAPPLQK